MLVFADCRYYSSNLSHRSQQKRKYAHLGDQNHILLAESKFVVPQSLPQSTFPSTFSSLSSTMTNGGSSSSTTIKASSFYSNNNKRHGQPPVSVSTIVSGNGIVEEVPSSEHQYPLQPHNENHSKQFQFRQTSGTNEHYLDRHQGSLYSPFPNRQNHVLESHPSPSIMDKEELQPHPHRKQEQQANHVDNWSETLPTNPLHSIKMVDNIIMFPFNNVFL